MMKKPGLTILIVLVLLTIATMSRSLRAQSFSEWFRQKKTQKKYLLAQISALQMYIKALEKGYDITRAGLSTVSSLKRGGFVQHLLHFQSLEMVSPRVKSYSKVLAIAQMEDNSARLRGVILSDTDTDREDYLNDREQASLRKRLKVADTEAKKDLEQLELIVTDGKLTMTDDERITRIDGLYVDVKKRLKTVQRLGKNVQALVASRRRQKRDVRHLNRLYGR